MTKTDYMAIRARLSFAPSAGPTLAVVAFDALLLAAVTLLLRRGGIGPYLLSQVLLAVVFFNAFSILHECGHGTASRAPVFNTLLGHVASAFCFIPYYPWKYIHQQHHLWTGNLERDPVLKSLRRFRDQGVPNLVQLSWWSWIPIAALLQHIVYLTYPLTMWRAGEMTRAKLVRSVASLLGLPLVYIVLWRLAPDLVRPSSFVLAVVIFLFAEEMVNLPHHVDMPTFEGKLAAWEQYRATRSCHYPVGVSELLVLNFNFHTEHHLFPDLPWYRLRRARTLVKQALESRYAECMGISWNVRNRTRDLDAIVARYRVAKKVSAI